MSLTRMVPTLWCAVLTIPVTAYVGWTQGWWPTLAALVLMCALVIATAQWEMRHHCGLICLGAGLLGIVVMVNGIPYVLRFAFAGYLVEAAGTLILCAFFYIGMAAGSTFLERYPFSSDDNSDEKGAR